MVERFAKMPHGNRALAAVEGLFACAMGRFPGSVHREHHWSAYNGYFGAAFWRKCPPPSVRALLGEGLGARGRGA